MSSSSIGRVEQFVVHGVVCKHGQQVVVVVETLTIYIWYEDLPSIICLSKRNRGGLESLRIEEVSEVCNRVAAVKAVTHVVYD